MHLNTLRVSNFLRIVGLTIDADGNHVIIQGRNGEGKTSVVEAIWEALKGSSLKDRPEPVHRGADKAVITLDLGEYIVEKHIAADGKNRLVLKDASGSRITSPQKLLDSLLSDYSLDPVAFLDRRPQDQVDDVLRVCEVNPPVEQVEAITGESCPPKPGESADRYMERLSADENGEWYVRRRNQHRVVETNRGAVEKQKTLCETITPAGETIRSIDEIIAEQDELQNQQDSHQAALRAKDEAQREWERLSNKYIQVDNEQKENFRLEAELEAKLKAVKEKIIATAERLDKGQTMVEDARLGNDAATAELNKYGDCSRQLQTLRAELQTAQKHQRQAIEAEQAAKRLEELQLDYEGAKAIHAKLDRQLEQLRVLRKGLLEGLDLGVDGLEVGQGELRLHGVSFKQASMAQKIRVACAVAMKGNGALKLLRIDNGEMLDSESRRFLLSLATEHGYQVIMTCVSDDEQLQVEIVDQEVEPVPAAKPVRKAPKGKLFETQLTATEGGM